MAMDVTWRGEVERVEKRGKVVSLRLACVLGDAWRVALSWDLLSPAYGPEALTVIPETDHERASVGGYDSDGIQQALLRSIPLAEMRDKLRDAWLDVRAIEIIQRIPDDFAGEVAFARIADVMTELVGLNVRNPVGLIARVKEGKHATWATRVRRARERGFLTEDFGLTPKSRALLGG